MRTADLSDAELNAYSAEHVLYEFQLLWFATQELSRLDKPSPMASVLIESFGIHLRNLIDFFFTPRSKPDDVIAVDFYPGWIETIPASLTAARDRLNKELSHLTLGRKTGLEPSKPWDVTGLFQEVSAIAKRFAAKAPSAKLSPEVRKWLNTWHGSQIAVGCTLGLVSSNTTATMVVGSSVTSAPTSKNSTGP